MEQTSHHTELTIAKSLARQAGKAILEVYGSEFSVTKKSDQSPVTEADLRSNAIIVKGLRLAFPGDAILTEEEEDDKTRFSTSRVWIIDPLDGTKEFVKRNGEFAISIGLIQGGKPLVGVIYAPARDEMYYAETGKTAFFEHAGTIEPLKVSTCGNLSESIVIRSGSSTDNRVARFDSLVKSSLSIGSALKGCLVARSHADFYPRFERLWEWDVCAMHLIVESAGGRVSSLDGSELTYNKENPRLDHGFIMSNGALHPHVLEVMRNG
ncbi:MAG TPA: 3'(2'),5'-bisphosphate nucleotidase CysQ [Candidatus Nanoarchaeia archaeon]|nr:3'(2'),5'-bisphosphate nucleotidase CysQ [Candidatus Nanoarchaeia archaeon]